MAAEKHIHRKSSKERHLAASSELWAKPRLTAQESSIPNRIGMYLSVYLSIHRLRYISDINIVYTVYTCILYNMQIHIEYYHRFDGNKTKKNHPTCFQDADNVKALMAGATPLEVSAVSPFVSSFVVWLWWRLGHLGHLGPARALQEISRVHVTSAKQISKNFHWSQCHTASYSKTRCVIKSLEDLREYLLCTKRNANKILVSYPLLSMVLS